MRIAITAYVGLALSPWSEALQKGLFADQEAPFLDADILLTLLSVNMGNG
jgi:hypothetical protein